MKSLFIICIALFVHQSDCLAQAESVLLREIAAAYKAFEYQEVLDLCQSLISDSALSDTTALTEIYHFQGLSYYALGDMSGSLRSLNYLLKLEPDYTMNPVTTPPKILKFFNEIKSTRKEQMSPEMSNADLNILQANFPDSKSIVYSFILPGFGHINEGIKTKGWILTSAAVLTLGASVYFIVDSNKKESQYLNTNDRNLIEQNYQKFNTSYRNRNISLAAFACIWLYSQIDLLIMQPSPTGFHINPMSQAESDIGIRLAYNF